MNELQAKLLKRRSVVEDTTPAEGRKEGHYADG